MSLISIPAGRRCFAGTHANGGPFAKPAGRSRAALAALAACALALALSLLQPADAQGMPAPEPASEARPSAAAAATYIGQIAPGQRVRAVLSGDYSELIITGAVRQVITAPDMQRPKYANPDWKTLNEVTDERQDSVAVGIVGLAQDFNGDGFNDLSILTTHGSGGENRAYFLYDANMKKYVYHAGMSKIPFLRFDQDRGRLESDESNGADGFVTSIYKFDARGAIYLAERQACRANRDAATREVVDYTLENVRYAADEKVVSSGHRQFPVQAVDGSGRPTCK